MDCYNQAQNYANVDVSKVINIRNQLNSQCPRNCPPSTKNLIKVGPIFVNVTLISYNFQKNESHSLRNEIREKKKVGQWTL